MELEQRWLAFWQAAAAPRDPLPAWRDLVRRYSEPHRACHALAHVADCLEELEPARTLANDVIAVELALWFHDAVYDTHRSDNEKRSASLATEVAQSMGLPGAARECVTGLILATRHDAVPSAGDEALVVDIDLAILGQPRERFDEYERQIRIEYAWVPRMIFDVKRKQILRALLERPTIYTTPHFRDRYEHAARENLRRSLGVGTH